MECIGWQRYCIIARHDVGLMAGCTDACFNGVLGFWMVVVACRFWFFRHEAGLERVPAAHQNRPARGASSEFRAGSTTLSAGRGATERRAL